MARRDAAAFDRAAHNATAEAICAEIVWQIQDDREHVVEAGREALRRYARDLDDTQIEKVVSALRAMHSLNSGYQETLTRIIESVRHERTLQEELSR